MDNFTTDVAVARRGAACLSARSPWTNLVAAGANHALGQNPVLAAGSPDARRAALRPAQAMGVQTAQTTQPTQSALVGAELLPTTDTVNFTKHVHKTRINAGGYGAMGPHPEREQLAY